MKTLALYLILSAPAFAQEKPATPAVPPAPKQPAAAPQTPTAPPAQMQNPCTAQVPMNILMSMTDVFQLRLQVIYSRQCSAIEEANRVLNDLNQAAQALQTPTLPEVKKGDKK